MGDKLKALLASMKPRIANAYASVKTSTGTFRSKLRTDIGELWQENKLFVFVFGALILVIKFREILINIIVANGKTIFNNATQQSAKDQKKEDQNNQDANALIKQAEDIGKNSPSIPDDWQDGK